MNLPSIKWAERHAVTVFHFSLRSPLSSCKENEQDERRDRIADNNDNVEPQRREIKKLVTLGAFFFHDATDANILEKNMEMDSTRNTNLFLKSKIKATIDSWFRKPLLNLKIVSMNTGKNKSTSKR